MTQRDQESIAESAHDEVFALLPWYANESLPEAEAALVRTHVAGCAACRQELGALDGLKRAVVASDEALPAPPPEALDRVLDRIEDYEAARAGATPAQTSDGRLARLAARWSLWPAGGRLALAGQFAALLLVAVALFFTAERARRFEDEAATQKTRADRGERMLRESEQRYETLTGPDARVRAAGARLNVAFQERATEKEIRELLGAVNATIVGGPSPQRIYVIELPAAEGPERRRAAAAALDGLRAKPQVVLFAAEQPE